MADDLDAQLRRYDEDRWLASRFARPDVRAGLIAVYALNHEIARTADVVTQPAIGDIRLAWWREAIEEVAAGEAPRPHPVLEAFAAAGTGRMSPLAVWDRLIAARGKELDAQPFETWRELEDYVDATTGGVMRAALAASGLDAAAHGPLVDAAAQAWGMVGLLRAEPHWRATGRVFLPHEGALEDIAAHARAAIAAAKTVAAPAAAFPALGYVALAGDYLRAHEKGAGAPALFTRQLKLIAAAATGRL